MSKELRFKVNAGIKNIVGKELIHSDSIAVIELVKNAKDASASTCKIFFENEMQTDGRIIIVDNGRGMTEEDIQEKWLNVAYSEKKGQKINTYLIKNRDVENSRKNYYAGSKGVGRFSCDRLAEKLVLYTKSVNGQFLKLTINWGDFENRGISDQMSSIPVWLEALSNQQFGLELRPWIKNIENFDHGTILLMEKLRSVWSASKLKKLISELEKFSPSIDDELGIFLYSNNSDKSLAKKINRRIQNNIFDKLNFKTTRIESKISPDGKTINTSLFYQDKKVYHYEVENPYFLLKDINVVIYYIDPLTRAYFTRNVGIKPVEYGSVFLFYNNFRISPYGNAKNDWLGLDQRKAQGRARYFGTRELLGKVFITDEDNTFEVLSNREGMAQNQAFVELVAFDREDKATLSTESNDAESYGYVINIIRQLENFVVNGLEWNRLFDKSDPHSSRVISEADILKNPERYSMKAISSEKVRSVCQKLLKSNWNITKIDVNDELVNDIYSESELKYKKFLEDFLGKVKDKSFAQLSSLEKGSVRKIIKKEIEAKNIALKQREEAEEREANAQNVIKKQERVLIEKTKTIQQINSLNVFLRRTANQETEDLLAFFHSIIVNGLTIQNYILRLLNRNNLNESDKDVVVTINEILEKILRIAKCATLYNYKDPENTINGELTLFIHECLKQEKQSNSSNGFVIQDSLDLNITTDVDFIPLEVMMSIGNIVSNSIKAEATVLKVSNKKNNEGRIQYIFEDNGKGLDDKYMKTPDLIFEKGETTTNGSGIGLYQIKRMVEKIKGRICVGNRAGKGFTLLIEV